MSLRPGYALMTQSCSGLGVTAPIGGHLRVLPDQRAGFLCHALKFKCWAGVWRVF